MSERELTERAAHHHSTLSAFAAVVALLEGGLIYDADADVAAQRIIAICKKEQDKQLRKYDRVLGIISEPRP